MTNARASRSNIDIIFGDWLDALRRGDREVLAARLAPDVVHQGIHPDWVCRGREAVLARMRKRAESQPPVDRLELVAAGDHIVLSVGGPGVGVPIEEADGDGRGQATIVFTLSEGVITEMRDYVHRSEALDAVGASADWR